MKVKLMNEEGQVNFSDVSIEKTEGGGQKIESADGSIVIELRPIEANSIRHRFRKERSRETFHRYLDYLLDIEDGDGYDVRDNQVLKIELLQHTYEAWFDDEDTPRIVVHRKASGKRVDVEPRAFGLDEFAE